MIIRLTNEHCFVPGFIICVYVQDEKKTIDKSLLLRAMFFPRGKNVQNVQSLIW